MPRTAPLRFEIGEEDKKFLYNLLKKIGDTLITQTSSNPRSRRDIIRLATKFPPGKSAVYLQDWERQVIVSWLLKLHNLALTRKQENLVGRFRHMIESFK